MQIYEWSDYVGRAKNRQAEHLQKNLPFLRMLDRGIGEMKVGRELPLEDAFKKITELRDIRRNVRV